MRFENEDDLKIDKKAENGVHLFYAPKSSTAFKLSNYERR